VYGGTASEEPELTGSIADVQSAANVLRKKGPVTTLCGANSPPSLSCDAEASRAAVLAGAADARVVLFSGHALGRGDPALASLGLGGVSALNLARPAGLERIWEHDLEHAILGADLLVLSACDTGTVDESVVTGGSGLARAGLVAGSRSVVSTSWSVDDRSSGELVTAFTGNYSAHQAPSPWYKAIALRDAQSVVRQRPGWSDPFYWAAFAVWGRPD
jgi:CHAT domain-containing protein